MLTLLRAVLVASLPAAPAPIASPHFILDAPESLPLKETRTEVSISGVIASIRTTQTYENTGPTNIEAVYVFPGNTRAALHAVEIDVGGRKTVARIHPRAKAQAIYDDAKSSGLTAALVKQHRDNVFETNVANILPGDVVKVTIQWSLLLVPNDGEYELVVPGVVGPRYVGSADDRASSEFVANTKYTSDAKKAPFFDLDVHLEAGMPIEAVRSPSHRVQTIMRGPSAADVVIDSADLNPGARDFVLRYRLGGAQIKSGVMLFPGDFTGGEESFFLLMLQPPAKLKPSEIPAREYVFIVDVSGSMHGYPLDTSKALMRALFAKLRPFDRFNVVMFAGGPGVLFEESREASGQNIGEAMRAIDAQSGNGGTELLAAVRAAMALPRASMPMARTLVLLTDGFVTADAVVLREIRAHLGEASMFAFGIGTSVNRSLIEGVARAGMGEPEVVLSPEEAAAKSARFAQRIASPVLTRGSVRFDGFDAYDIEPASLPDLYAERPVIVFGKYRGAPRGSIVVRGSTGTGAFEARVSIDAAAASANNRALRWLWARDRVAGLEDRLALEASAPVAPEIEQLGLRYSLVTSQTSFVAVDDVRRASSRPARVIQPVQDPKTGRIYEFSDLQVEGQLAKPEANLILNPRPKRPTVEDSPVLDARIDQLRIDGPLTEAKTRTAIEKRLSALAECTETPEARYAIELAIDGRGRIFGVNVRPLRGTKASGDCLARRLAHMRISNPIDLGEASMVRIEVTLIQAPPTAPRQPLRTSFGDDLQDE